MNYNSINTEEGNNKEDWKWKDPIYVEFRNKHQLDENQIDKLLHKIGWAESKNKNIEQNTKAGGQGYYQMEDNTASGTFKTSINQYKNILKKKKMSTPQWIKDINHDDPKKLTHWQQSVLALAKIYQSKDSDERIKNYKNGVKGAEKEIWIKDWWKGSILKENSKRKQWDGEMNDLKRLDTYKKNKGNQIISNMIDEDNPLQL